MSRAGDTAIAAEVQHRRRVVVDVILLLMRNGRILLRERANTGYGDGAYEPPTGQLADRETIVETAIRVASAEAGIAIQAENVSLAHVMHDVSGSGRIAFFLTVSGWQGEYTSPDAGWFGVGNLPTNMLDRSRVALRNYADGHALFHLSGVRPGLSRAAARLGMAGRLQRLTARTRWPDRLMKWPRS